LATFMPTGCPTKALPVEIYILNKSLVSVRTVAIIYNEKVSC